MANTLSIRDAFINYNMAFESVFIDTQSSIAETVERLETVVNTEITNVAQASALLDKVNEEALKFNQIIKNMTDAMNRCEQGEITKDEMMTVCAPYIKELKANCTALELADVSVSDDITQEELEAIQNLISAAIRILECKKNALANGDETPKIQVAGSVGDDDLDELDEDDVGLESYIGAFEATMVANEGFFMSKDEKKIYKEVKDRVEAMKKEFIAADGDEETIERLQAEAKEIQEEAKEIMDKKIRNSVIGLVTGILATIGGAVGVYKLSKKKKANESFSDLEDLGMDEEALEAFTTNGKIKQRYVRSTEWKTAVEGIYEGKKLFKNGDITAAKDKIKSSQAMFEKILDKVMKDGKFVDVERAVGEVKGNENVTEKVTLKRSETAAYNSLQEILKKKIIKCQALLMQWENKAGNKSLFETEEKLMRESGLEHITLTDVEKLYIKSLESEMVTLNDEIAMVVAVEAETGEGADGSAIQETAEKLKKLESELKQAQANEDSAEAAKIMAEIEKITTTAAQKSASNGGWKKVVLIGTGIVAVIATAAGVGTAVKAKRKNIKMGEAGKELAGDVKSFFGAAKGPIGKFFGKFKKSKPLALPEGKGETEATTESWVELLSVDQDIVMAVESWEIDTFNFDVAVEGLNRDAMKTKSMYAAQFKVLIKEAKKAQKVGDSSTATAKLDEAAKVIDKYVAEIKKLSKEAENDPSAATRSVFIGAIMTDMRTLLIGLGFGSAGTLVAELVNALKMVKRRDAKLASGEEITMADYNRYISLCLNAADRAKSTIAKIKKKLAAGESNGFNTEATESFTAESWLD